MLKVPKFSDVIDKQRNFFGTGKTKDISFRIEQLKLLKKAIVDNKEAILKALQSDLNKPEFEAYGLEIAFCLEEINNVLKNINNWTKPKKIKAPITQFLSTAKIYSEPLGVVLIIGPWNYPFQLVIAPLVAAIASGNCAILKPSEISLNTSHLLAEIILKYFNPEFVAVVEGGVDTSQQLLEEKFDHIFFTGSGEIGRIVMAAAAKHLTPVTLELGGKTPCIVDAKTHLEYTARRIVWGKFMNAGQTCVAPDYLLVDRKIKKDLLEQIKKCISEFYGENPEKSPDYARIINQKHFNRLCKYLDSGEIVIGGDTNPSEKYIAPTLIEGVDWQDAVMQEEIFGPILPVIEYTELTEAIALVNAKPKPLALYFFSTDKQKQQRVLHQTSSGGACINDTVMHLAVLDLPFGGVGESGIGRYHGKAGFDTFSHQKSVLNKSFLVDVKLRYAPYLGKLKLLKWLIK
ncbi:aldehyde dehydrogenase [Trichocoleus sp. FACHB-90]|uniref:aldehyde dehydrogenase n=1 Tax=Cyanophyceae TaxID=3028117 RepID=UPI001686352C|nr:aldehyde dehydrogenase [Trichocoleus sp. FACHB-90]MBD1927845.1 aldehyde dehydrogenase [Trichocoleus sp. FACHB-90]